MPEKKYLLHFFFQDALSDRDYFIGYARIRDSRTTGWILQNPSPRYHNGIFIDLYPLDVIPNNIYIWKVQSFLIESVLRRLIKHDYKTNKKIKDIRYKSLVFLHKLCCSIFDKQRNPKRVGNIYSPHEIETGYWFYAEDVKKVIQLNFEYTSFSAPGGYDRILKNVYGNYMKFPPKGKRGIWHDTQVVFDPDVSYLEFYKNKMRRK